MGWNLSQKPKKNAQILLKSQWSAQECWKRKIGFQRGSKFEKVPTKCPAQSGQAKHSLPVRFFDRPCWVAMNKIISSFDILKSTVTSMFPHTVRIYYWKLTVDRVQYYAYVLISSENNSYYVICSWFIPCGRLQDRNFQESAVIINHKQNILPVGRGPNRSVLQTCQGALGG